MKSVHISLVLFASVLLSGCGLTVQQKKQLSQYSATTIETGSQSADEFRAMQKMVVQANRYNLIFDGMTGYTQLDNLKGDLSDTNINPRVTAAEALEAYGELLARLVAKSEKDNLQAAAQEMLKGARKFNSALISDDVGNGIEKAVMAGGGLYLEKKKAEAIRKVVLGYKDVIDAVCDALTVDFGDDTGGVRQNAEAVIEETKMTGADILRKKESTVLERNIAMSAVSFTQESLSQISEQGEPIQTAARKLKQINNDLAKALESGFPRDFGGLKEEIQGLVALQKKLTE
jgi:hypothetical protein